MSLASIALAAACLEAQEQEQQQAAARQQQQTLNEAEVLLHVSGCSSPSSSWSSSPSQSHQAPQQAVAISPSSSLGDGVVLTSLGNGAGSGLPQLPMAPRLVSLSEEDERMSAVTSEVQRDSGSDDGGSVVITPAVIGGDKVKAAKSSRKRKSVCKNDGGNKTTKAKKTSSSAPTSKSQSQLPNQVQQQLSQHSKDESDSIVVVHQHDVLCGRGGETNHHPGNVHYRRLVKSLQREYLDARRRDKPLIARRVVDAVLARDPPGRFLKKKDGGGSSSGWYEIGLTKAREKTSQALREGAPDIRTSSASSSYSSSSELALQQQHPKLIPHAVVSGSSDEDEQHFAAPQQANQSSSVGMPPPSSCGATDKSGKRSGPRLKLFKARMTVLGDEAPSPSFVQCSEDASLPQHAK